jgi:hypothetical protein
MCATVQTEWPCESNVVAIRKTLRDVGEVQMEISSVRAAQCCWICGKPVSLENCKVDEQGFPVHGECYVVRVALNSVRPATQRGRRRSA